MTRLFALCLLLPLLCACAAVLPARPATPTVVPTTPATPEPATPSDTPTAVKPTNTPEPSLTPTPEAPKIVFAGATKPNTDSMYLDAINPDIHFEVPVAWTVPLAPNELDPNPYVASGDLGGYSLSVTGSGLELGAVLSEEYFGVDFRGIELVQRATDPRASDVYVAGFSFVNEGKLYVLTVPIFSGKWSNPKVPISQDGEFLYINKPLPKVPRLWGKDAIEILQTLQNQNKSRRMVLTITTGLTNASGNIMKVVSPGYGAFIDAVTKGLPLPPDGKDIRIGLPELQLPIDLD